MAKAKTVKATETATPVHAIVLKQPSTLVVDAKNNTRKNPPSQQQVEKIAASIKEIGQLQPIGIDENNNVVYGFTRAMALQTLEATGMQVQAHCVIVAAKTAKEKYIANLTENAARNEYTPLDFMHIALNAKKNKTTLDELAVIFGKDKSFWSRIALVAKTPECIQNAVGERVIGHTTAIMMVESQLSHADMETLFNTFGENLTANHVRAYVEKMNEVNNPKTPAKGSTATGEDLKDDETDTGKVDTSKPTRTLGNVVAILDKYTGENDGTFEPIRLFANVLKLYAMGQITDGEVEKEYMRIEKQFKA